MLNWKFKFWLGSVRSRDVLLFPKWHTVWKFHKNLKGKFRGEDIYHNSNLTSDTTSDHNFFFTNVWSREHWCLLRVAQAAALNNCVAPWSGNDGCLFGKDLRMSWMELRSKASYKSCSFIRFIRNLLLVNNCLKYLVFRRLLDLNLKWILFLRQHLQQSNSNKNCLFQGCGEWGAAACGGIWHNQPLQIHNLADICACPWRVVVAFYHSLSTFMALPVIYDLSKHSKNTQLNR